MKAKGTKNEVNITQDEPLLGSSPEAKRLQSAVTKLAEVNNNVFIVGEAGTGKEFIARQIYLQSPRRNRAFIEIKCSELGKTIGKKELYGEESEEDRAVKRDIGLLEKANKGILFLDKIGDMNPDYQEEFLRILRDNKLRRVGGSENIKLDLRIITSSEEDLLPDIQTGRFKKDLYYLLNTLILYIPPLRERKQDIPELFSYFLKKFCAQEGREEPAVPVEIFESILEYDWKGNVRELENTVQNLIMMSPQQELSPEFLPFRIKKHPLDFLEPTNLKKTIADIQSFLIQKALKKVNGNQVKAAKILGVPEPTLRFKMKRYAIPNK